MKIEFLATVILVVLMVEVLVVVYIKTNSLLKAWIVSLIVGKTLTVVFWAFGITHIVATVYLYDKLHHRVIPVQITSNLVILLSFLITLIVSLFWYDLVRLAPKSFRNRLRKTEVIK